MAATASVDEIVARASSLTDVTDAAPHHFLDNLTAVVDALNHEAALTDEGLQGILGQLVPALRNRIEVDAYVAERPEVDESPLPAPIFLTGLPRSGTTYFQYLFDQDPRLRMLRTWEGDRPSPPPALDPESAARRHAQSVENARIMRELTGGKIDAFHLTDVDGPQECLAILDQTFVNPGLLWTMSVFGYLEYLLHEADLREAYDYHARVLRLLQQGAPERRWALKWPCHLLALEAIAAVHPDATFVVTHRDPVQALASNCSLTNMLRAGTSPHADPEHIGRDMLELVRQHVDRLVAFDVEQEKLGSGRLVHVDYYQLVDDPAVVMPAVFEAVDLEWTAEVDERVRTWREANPKGKRGTHEYDLTDYGLEREAVAEAFAPYTERFGIPSESVGA
ncbi:MAG TPA: sulfotransferase [Acidimicrobiia bacterium]|nr:sulfotransferase [Acidimicrobiia bacterium]